MKYVGILRSGREEGNDMAVGVNGIERLLPNQDTIGYLSGFLENKGLATLLVRFYQASRETQEVTLQPSESIEVKNIPCQRLNLRSVGATTTTNYTFVMLQADGYNEDRHLLLYSDIKKNQTVEAASVNIAAAGKSFYPALATPAGGVHVGDTFASYRPDITTPTDRRAAQYYYQPTLSTGASKLYGRGFANYIVTDLGNIQEVFDLSGVNLTNEVSSVMTTLNMRWIMQAVNVSRQYLFHFSDDFSANINKGRFGLHTNGVTNTWNVSVNGAFYNSTYANTGVIDALFSWNWREGELGVIFRDGDGDQVFANEYTLAIPQTVNAFYPQVYSVPFNSDESDTIRMYGWECWLSA